MTQCIGILGATFDPPHLGHLEPAYAALEQLQLDEIWLMPNKAPKYKQEPVASDTQRWMMTELAAATHPRLKACDLELKRNNFQPTHATMIELKKKHPNNQFYFLMGIDSWSNLHHWKNWQYLTENNLLIVYERPNQNKGQINSTVLDWASSRTLSCHQVIKQRPEHGYCCHIQVPQHDISSTQLRALFQNEPDQIGTWMPSTVADYIKQHKIYT
jgi:nicotinate-nucleotide adenylyltransferase